DEHASATSQPANNARWRRTKGHSALRLPTADLPVSAGVEGAGVSAVGVALMRAIVRYRSRCVAASSGRVSVGRVADETGAVAGRVAQLFAQAVQPVGRQSQMQPGAGGGELF